MNKFVILVLYVDDILLADNDVGVLHDIEKFLSMSFEIKDMGELSHVIGIKIFRNRLPRLSGLSKKCYINKILEKFRMNKCSVGIVLIHKGDKFSQM